MLRHTPGWIRTEAEEPGQVPIRQLRVRHLQIEQCGHATVAPHHLVEVEIAVRHDRGTVVERARQRRQIRQTGDEQLFDQSPTRQGRGAALQTRRNQIGSGRAVDRAQRGSRLKDGLPPVSLRHPRPRRAQRDPWNPLGHEPVVLTLSAHGDYLRIERLGRQAPGDASLVLQSSGGTHDVVVHHVLGRQPYRVRVALYRFDPGGRQTKIPQDTAGDRREVRMFHRADYMSSCQKTAILASAAGGRTPSSRCAEASRANWTTLHPPVQRKLSQRQRWGSWSMEKPASRSGCSRARTASVPSQTTPQV
jgi:hypothetical protein